MKSKDTAARNNIIQLSSLRNSISNLSKRNIHPATKDRSLSSIAPDVYSQIFTFKDIKIEAHREGAIGWGTSHFVINTLRFQNRFEIVATPRKRKGDVIVNKVIAVTDVNDPSNIIANPI